MTFKNKKGFTLLEILLVVGIIAILAGIVIVAINPSKQLAQTRDTERRSDIKQIYNAMTQYYIDHGFYPASSTLSITLKEICNTGTATSAISAGVNCTGLIDLSPLVPVYVVAIPQDPLGSTAVLPLTQTAYAAGNGTDYLIAASTTSTGGTNGILSLSAPLAERSIITLGPIRDRVLLSSEKDITSFSILGISGNINGNIISLTLPYGTSFTNLTPTITISASSTVNPASGIRQDFTGIVQYTVTAENLSTKEYEVILYTAAPLTCTSFTYTDWVDCDNGTQTRIILTSSPDNCEGGNPVLSQSCISLLPNGSICTNSEQCSGGNCAEGYDNVWGSYGDGTLRCTYSDGFGCHSNSDCSVSSNVCVWYFGGATRWCAAPRQNNTGPCDNPSQCQSNYCNTSNNCSDRQIGALCNHSNSNYYSVDCVTNYCNANSQCSDRQIGANCANNNDCDSNNCNMYSNTCAAGWISGPGGEQWSPETNSMLNWDMAGYYCSGLGYRLPTKNELINALEFYKNGGNPTGGFSSNVSYWSSDEDINNSSNAWRVYIYDGFGGQVIPSSDEKYYNFSARCVR